MNREAAIRAGFSDTLKTGIINGSAQVHIYDSSPTGEVQNELLYMLLTGQSSVLQPEDGAFTWSCLQTIEIVHKQMGSVTKQIVDSISEQIENAIIFVADGNGMTDQQGWQFLNVFLENVNYSEFELSENFYEITKILDFRVAITKIS